MRLALATASFMPELDEDGPALIRALDDHDVSVQVLDDETVDWAAFDLVVVRSTWDYAARRDEFLAWADSVPRLLNPAVVLRWNTDKHYLRELAAKGVPIVPTSWVRPGGDFQPPEHDFVVKPTVSSGARDAAAYRAGDDAAAVLVRQIHDSGRTVMVQPYINAVDPEGETSLLFLDGQFSHAARKSALLAVGQGVDNTINSRAFVNPCEATAEQLDLARRVLEQVPHELLYARVDLMPGPVLIELEITEPSLFLGHSPGSAERFARAIERAGAATRSW